MISPALYFTFIVLTIAGPQRTFHRGVHRVLRRRREGSPSRRRALLRDLPLPQGFVFFYMGYAAAMSWLLFRGDHGDHARPGLRQPHASSSTREAGDGWLSAAGPGRRRRRRDGAGAAGRLERARHWCPRREPPKQALFLFLLILLSIIFIYPFIWLISASLKPSATTFDNKLIPETFVPWYENYTEGRGSRPARDVVLQQPLDLGLGAILVTFSSAMVAFAFAYFDFPGRTLLFAIVLATMMLPVAVTMIPTYLIWQTSATSPGCSSHIGVNTQDPLWVPNLFGSAFYIFLLRQFFLGIPRELFEAARIDGDNFFTMFLRIALPLAKPALIVAFIFEIQAKWNDLITPLIYLTEDKLYTIPLGIKDPRPLRSAGRRGRVEDHRRRDGDPSRADGDHLRDLPAVLRRAASRRRAARGSDGAAAPRREVGLARRRPCSRSTSAARSWRPASSTRRAASTRSSSRRRGRRTGPTRCSRGCSTSDGSASPSRASRGRGSRRSASAAAVRSTPTAGVLLAPPHLPGWVGVPIVDRGARVRAAGVLENDGTAAAAGEHLYGAGRRDANMVYLTISTGVGGGVVVDGRLYRGAGRQRRRARPHHGRLARPALPRVRPPGCLEAYASGTSIAERAARRRVAHGGDAPTATAADSPRPRARDPIATRGVGGDHARARLRSDVDREPVRARGGRDRRRRQPVRRAAARAGPRPRAGARDRHRPAVRSRSSSRRSATTSASSARPRSRTTGSPPRRSRVADTAATRSPSTCARPAASRRCCRWPTEVGSLLIATYQGGGRLFASGTAAARPTRSTWPRSSSGATAATGGRSPPPRSASILRW